MSQRVAEGARKLFVTTPYSEEVDVSEADTVFVSCIGLGIIDAAPMMEQDFGKTVITSNQATWWATLRGLGIKDDLGFGRLFKL